MGITILQINIRSWKNNRYTLLTEMCNYNPDILLINETGNDPAFRIKMQGYTTIEKSEGKFSGVAILIKHSLSYENVITADMETLAIKLLTTFGPIIISTAYTPPRRMSLPTTSLNKLFGYNLPILFIGDLNAHHPDLDNVTIHNRCPDNKGKQLHTIMLKHNMSCIGPFFNTFITKNAKGKPDIILINDLFQIFNHKIIPGANIGSDHIPIVFNFQVKPILTLKEPKLQIKSLNVQNFKTQLRSLDNIELNNNPIIMIDSLTENLMLAINKATNENCKINSILITRNYIPTTEIKEKLAIYQEDTMDYYRFGNPNLQQLHTSLNDIINLTKKHLNDNWDSIVQLAYENYKNPSKFWQSIKHLLGNSTRPPQYLLQTLINDDSEDENFGNEDKHYITDAKQQANFMSQEWTKVFTDNKGPEFNNINTALVNEWFCTIKPLLTKHNIVDKSLLIEDHPLMRPVTVTEIRNSLAYTKNKAPGISGIYVHQLKNLPANCYHIIENIYNAILASHHIPSVLENIKMIFLNKPNKDATSPLNYRPICLLETLIKTLEKIMANRLQYYLEHNNLLSEKQFGFRPCRNTQHAINLIQDTVLVNNSHKHTTLIATRDVEKAFDKVWHKGLLYKINDLPEATTDFLAFLYNFLKSRKIIPTFQNEKGPIIIPKSGVPQGSSLGPVLYSVYVNDHPQPLHKSTIISQFADDLVHVVKSNGKGKNKNKNAIVKLRKELEQTLQWERNWKIKSNPQKCNIGISGASLKSFNKLNQIKIDNIKIKYTDVTKILGFNLTHTKKSTKHVTAIASRAHFNLRKLIRFRSAPSKIKLHLYKALIRPILEYPCYPLSITSKASLKKLQLIQNRALRFVKNIKLKDKIRTKSIHDELKIEPLNIRLHQLAQKNITQIYELYLGTADSWVTKPYKFSDYEISKEPQRKKKRTTAMRIKKYIYNSTNRHKRVGILWKFNAPLNWPNPTPLF